MTFEAGVELYDRFGSVAYGLAYAVLGDQALAEEVVASSFLTLRREAGRASPSEPGTMRSRVLVLVHRRAVAVARDRRGPDIGTSISAMPRQTSHLLARLPTAEGEAVALAYFGGLTLSEVAQVTGRARETVVRLVSSGLEWLGQPSAAGNGSPRKIVAPTRTSVAPSSAATR